MKALMTVAAALALAGTASAQSSHVVVVTGVGGGGEYAATFNRWASGMLEVARAGGVPAGNVAYLSGDTVAGVPRSTKANVEAALTAATGRAGMNDLLLILLIGHGSHAGAESRLNLPGPDITAAGISKILSRAQSRNVVLVNAASASGDFVQALAAPGRTVITATKSSAEQNETQFARYFVDALAGGGADTDKDGRTSILEAFEYARREVTRAYAADNRLLTEHAMMDDGADGAVARSLFLGLPGRPAVPTDAATAALLDQKREIEARLAALRRRKDSMTSKDYEAQLERLLIELAEKDGEIRSRTVAP